MMTALLIATLAVGGLALLSWARIPKNLNFRFRHTREFFLFVGVACMGLAYFVILPYTKPSEDLTDRVHMLAAALEPGKIAVCLHIGGVFDTRKNALTAESCLRSKLVEEGELHIRNAARAATAKTQ